MAIVTVNRENRPIFMGPLSHRAPARRNVVYFRRNNRRASSNFTNSLRFESLFFFFLFFIVEFTFRLDYAVCAAPNGKLCLTGRSYRAIRAAKLHHSTMRSILFDHYRGLDDRAPLSGRLTSSHCDRASRLIVKSCNRVANITRETNIGVRN